MQQLRLNVALVDKLTHTYIHVYVYVEQGQVACSKQSREKRTSDICGIIIKHKLLMECKVKKWMILVTDCHLTTLISFSICWNLAVRWCSLLLLEVLCIPRPKPNREPVRRLTELWKTGQDIGSNGIKKQKNGQHVSLLAKRTYKQPYFRTTWKNRNRGIRLLLQVCLLTNTSTHRCSQVRKLFSFGLIFFSFSFLPHKSLEASDIFKGH